MGDKLHSQSEGTLPREQWSWSELLTMTMAKAGMGVSMLKRACIIAIDCCFLLRCTQR